MKAIQAKENIYYVGVQDPNLRVFDIVMYTEYGTSYNSYLVTGSEKTALFETVKSQYFAEHVEKIQSVIPLDKLDYIVVDHTEPDHSGSIEKLLELAPNATVLATATAVSFLKEIINKPFKHKTVTEKDQIDLGGLTLTFLNVPMLHWPDSMYTYIPEAKALFSCDSFGCHYADERVFNDLIDGDFTDAYQYYFDNIIGPYKNPHMLNALKKIDSLDITFIGNGHGPVLRSNIKKYLEMYRAWSEPQAKTTSSAAIVYVSAYGYTASLAQKIADGLKDGGYEKVELFDLTTDDKAKATAAVMAADACLFGSPTILGDALPPVYEMLLCLNPVIHRGKSATAFGSYGWSGEAVGNLMDRLSALKMKLPLPGFKVRLKPSETQLQEAYQYGIEFAKATLC